MKLIWISFRFARVAMPKSSREPRHRACLPCRNSKHKCDDGDEQRGISCSRCSRNHREVGVPIPLCFSFIPSNVPACQRILSISAHGRSQRRWAGPKRMNLPVMNQQQAAAATFQPPLLQPPEMRSLLRALPPIIIPPRLQLIPLSTSPPPRFLFQRFLITAI
jgi:hypothetical protein